jgi:hypothetical protein
MAPLQVLTAAQQGCNVIVWFAINIRLNQTSNEPIILGGPDPDCVADVAKNLSGVFSVHLRYQLTACNTADTLRPYA